MYRCSSVCVVTRLYRSKQLLEPLTQCLADLNVTVQGYWSKEDRASEAIIPKGTY